MIEFISNSVDINMAMNDCKPLNGCFWIWTMAKRVGLSDVVISS